MLISKIIARGILSAAKSFLPSATVVARPKYCFSKLENIKHFKKVLDEEIKQEETHPQSITEYEDNFKTAGWIIAKDNTLVELSKTIGNYQVRLLSNIRSPTNFQNEQKEDDNQPKDEEEDPNADMAQIGIFVTKKGSQKTMIVNTIVTKGFQITGINFAPNYNQAKAARFSLQNSNQYTGPSIDSLPDTLFESIYGFLEETLGIENEFLNQFADYCLDSEQDFYLNWLRDIRSIV